MTNTPVPVVDYNAFSARVHAQSNTKRIPLAGALEVTYRCNFRCVHCYCVDQPPKNEMSFEEIRGLLDQMADAGCLWLLLTGGEPFLRKDFPDIYRYARAKGIIVTVFTNGSLLREADAELFGTLKPFLVEITLYGASPETYHAVTGRAEHFEQVLRGIDLLRKHQVPLQLKSMLFRENVHELPKLRELARSRGLAYRFDPILGPSTTGQHGLTSHMLSPEEIVSLDLSDEERMKEMGEFCSKFLGAGIRDRLFKCGAGQWSFHVDPEGRFGLCSFAKKDLYDLRTGTFREAFYDFLPRVLAQKTTRVTKCTTCNLASLCGQCAAYAYLYSGDPEEPIEYLCRVAHARAQAFGLKTVDPNA